jgi:hypothetical protein
VFNADDEKKTYYLSELQKLKEAFGGSDVVKLWLYYVDIVPSVNYQRLLQQWGRDRRNCSSDVIAGLVSGSLMTFTHPVFEEVRLN